MGLDCSHNCWHGPHSAFTRWRHAVARAAGYWVAPITYEDGFKMDSVILDWGHLPPGHLEGEWDEIPSDPLVIILTHQDCQGRIKSEHCEPIANALEAILPNLNDEPSEWKSDAERTRLFVAGLRMAAAAKEDVQFH